MISRRQLVKTIVSLIIVIAVVSLNDIGQPSAVPKLDDFNGPAATALKQLAVKGRAPKTNYSRDQFGSG